MTVMCGDCRDIMPTLPEGSFDAVVTDPPYELGFMGREWDKRGVAFDPDTWRAALRMLKPGGYLLAFGGTRTYHRMVCAIEDAGFEIRDQIQYIYGSGFPKSLNLDGEWSGWGSALKPAHEPIVVARKPLIGTVAENIAAHGCGALNIDGCRIPTEESGIREHKGAVYDGVHDGYQRPGKSSYTHKTDWHMPPLGRWPANVVHDGSEEVLAHFPDASGQLADISATAPSEKTSVVYGRMRRDGEASAERRYTDTGATNFAALPGSRRLDTGSAARFFYCAKASREDRDEGLDGFEKRELLWSSGTQNPGSFQSPNTDRSARNFHPTVKPTSLMRWLVRLVTPPGGKVLDPFAGSGSTGKACELEGFDYVLIEGDEQYIPIIEARLSFAKEQRRMATAQQSLFAEVQ